MAAELEDGLYTIRMTSNVNRCIGVKANSDAGGANVEVQAVGAAGLGGTGQVAFVSKRDGGYVIGFPLTGKVLDLSKNAPAEGANVQQWDFNDTSAQKWNLVAAEGKYAVVGGQTLQAYIIEYAADTNWHVASKNGSSAAGANVVLAGSTSQSFVFAPVQSVPSGTYRIAPVLAGGAVCGVKGNSSANSASVVLVAEADDSNWQVYKVDVLDDATCSIRCAQTGRALDASGGVTLKSGNDAIHYTWHAGDNQRWLTKMRATGKRNGSSMPLYAVVPKQGASFALDVNGSKSSPGTNVRVWNGDAAREAQRFFFVPAEGYAKTLAVPSDLRLMVSAEHLRLAGVSGSGTAYPSWRGGGEEWKARYRTRTRKVGQANGTRSSWSGWRSLSDGSTANDGWGQAGVANATASLGDGRYTAEQGVAYAIGAGSGATDLVDVEFQVRQLTHGYGDLEIDAHGGKASQLCTLAYLPTLTLSGLTVTPTGASVGYSSSLNRSGNRVRVWCDGLFEATATGAARSGTLKASKLKRVPEDGEEVAVGWEVTTCDSVTATGSTMMTLACDMTKAAAMTATDAWVASGALLRVTAQAGSVGARMWMTFGGETVEVPALGTNARVFEVPYPFDAAFSLYMAATVGGVVKVWRKSYTARKAVTRLWNWEGGWCQLLRGLNEPPTESVDTAPTSDSRVTTMRRWGVTQVGTSRSQSRTVSGLSDDEVPGSSMADVEALAACRFAWYRNPGGEVCRVAVVGVSRVESRPGVRELSVEMRRVDA